MTRGSCRRRHYALSLPARALHRRGTRLPWDVCDALARLHGWRAPARLAIRLMRFTVPCWRARGRPPPAPRHPVWAPARMRSPASEAAATASNARQRRLLRREAERQGVPPPEEAAVKARAPAGGEGEEEEDEHVPHVVFVGQLPFAATAEEVKPAQIGL